MTVTVKSKMPLVVPPSVRRRAGFKSGDKLEFKVTAGVVTIFPEQDSDDALTPEEEKIVRRGDSRATPSRRITCASSCSSPTAKISRGPVQVASECAAEGTRIDVVQIGSRAPEVIPDVSPEGLSPGFAATIGVPVTPS